MRRLIKVVVNGSVALRTNDWRSGVRESEDVRFGGVGLVHAAIAVAALAANANLAVFRFEPSAIDRVWSSAAMAVGAAFGADCCCGSLFGRQEV